MLSENEGANFWLRVLADLNNRGVKDILIASVDGLKGFRSDKRHLPENGSTTLYCLSDP